MKTCLPAAVLALLCMGASAHAQTKPVAAAPMTPEQRFAAADRNKDSKVDKAEFLATLIPDAKPYIDSIWINRDTNKDGWLTMDEMTTNGPAPRLRPGEPVTGTAPPSPTDR